MQDLKQFAKLVADMRGAQKEYFALAGKARKTNSTVDYAAAKTMLQRSKGLETGVDEHTARILTA